MKYLEAIIGKLQDPAVVSILAFFSTGVGLAIIKIVVSAFGKGTQDKLGESLAEVKDLAENLKADNDALVVSVAEMNRKTAQTNELMRNYIAYSKHSEQIKAKIFEITEATPEEIQEIEEYVAANEPQPQPQPTDELADLIRNL